MNLILGIDPGLTGALALYNPADKRCPEILPMPTVPDGRKRMIDPLSIALWLDKRAKEIKFCVCENVHAMPEQGVVSMFRFGMGFGMLRALTAAYWIPTHFAEPAVWKSLMHLSSDKAQSRQMATTLFPNQAKMFARAKDDGRAEALLLAVYGSLYVKS